MEASDPRSESTAGVTVEKVRLPIARLKLMLWATVLCAALALPIAWNARGRVGADGVSYLDIASNTARLSPHYLISNGMWSPVYPGLIAIAVKLTHPSLVGEQGLAHEVDWLLFAATCFGFTYFLYNLLTWVSFAHGPVFETNLRFYGILTLGYGLLFVSNMDHSLWEVGADKLLEGLIYVAAGVCIRLTLPKPRLIHYILLGVILAIAYTTKSPLFPISLALIAILFVWPAGGYGRKGTVVIAISFLLVASPLVISLSYNKGRLTFGDAGRVNYARSVNRSVPLLSLPLDFWAGRSPRVGMPVHPPEWVSTDPVILKFNGPAKATTPLWYDPTYWMDGEKVHFDLRQQGKRFLHSFGIIGRSDPFDGTNLITLALPWLPLFAGIAVFCFLGFGMRIGYQAMQRQNWLFLWPACAIFIYASIYITYRYLMPFAVLGWIGIFVAAYIVTTIRRADYIVFPVVAALLLINGRELAVPVAKMLLPAHQRPDQDVALARKLQRLGIRRGDELCLEGAGLAGYGLNYARLIGARVTLVIPEDSQTLTRLNETEISPVIDKLRASGAKAVISQRHPAFNSDLNWIPIPEFGLYVRLIKSAADKRPGLSVP